MPVTYREDRPVRWKVSFCDEADFVVSTFEVEAFSPWNAVMNAMIMNGERIHKLRTVIVNKCSDLTEELTLDLGVLKLDYGKGYIGTPATVTVIDSNE